MADCGDRATVSTASIWNIESSWRIPDCSHDILNNKSQRAKNGKNVTDICCQVSEGYGRARSCDIVQECRVVSKERAGERPCTVDEKVNLNWLYPGSRETKVMVALPALNAGILKSEMIRSQGSPTSAFRISSSVSTRRIHVSERPMMRACDMSVVLISALRIRRSGTEPA